MSNLAKYRRQAGLTQLELAAAIGISQGAITHLETGRTKSPEFETVRAILRVLKEKGVECTGDDVFPPHGKAA